MSDQRNLIVVNDSSLAKGGATALAIESALGAARAGWKVSYVSQMNQSPDPRLLESGVKLVEVEGNRVSGTNPTSGFRTGIWNGPSLKALEYEIEQTCHHNTIIHVHNWAHFLSPSIFKVLRKHQSRVVFSTHDYFMACGNGGQFNFQTREPCSLVGNSIKCRATHCDKNNYLHKIWRSTRHDMRQITFPAEGLKGKLALVHPKQRPFFERAGFPRDHIRVVRNPVTPIAKDRIRAEQNSTILFIGRLDVEKGAEEAAQAAQKANMKIVFAGEGPLMAKIQQTYSNAETHGFCDRPKLQALMQDARLLIMPSWLETFGLAAVESLWSGIPVLISKNALLADDIISKDAGALIDPKDIDSTSEIIRALMVDNKRVERMSENAFKNCNDIANTPVQWNQANLDLYEEILPPKPDSQIPKPHTLTIALLNVHYSANLGDGLLSDCLAHGLQHSGRSITSFPVDLAGRQSIATLGGSNRGVVLNMLSRLPNSIRQAVMSTIQRYYLWKLWQPHYENKLKDADQVILGGGNLIVDQDLNFPVKINAALRVAKNLNLPVHIYGVGVGKEFSKKGLELFQTAFSECNLRSVRVRDEGSRENWNENFATKCGHHAEIVHDPGILSPRTWPTADCPPNAGKPIDCAVGIISPNELNYHHQEARTIDLKKWYLELVGTLKRLDLNLVLFSNGSPEDTKFMMREIAPAFDDIKATIPNNQYELSALLAHARLTIAFRLHAIIPATSYGNQVVALEWDKKVRSFMTRIGKPEQCLNICETRPDTAAELCARLISEPLPTEDYVEQAAIQIAELSHRL